MKGTGDYTVCPSSLTDVVYFRREGSVVGPWHRHPATGLTSPVPPTSPSRRTSTTTKSLWSLDPSPDGVTPCTRDSSDKGTGSCLYVPRRGDDFSANLIGRRRGIGSPGWTVYPFDPEPSRRDRTQCVSPGLTRSSVLLTTVTGPDCPGGTGEGFSLTCKGCVVSSTE